MLFLCSLGYGWLYGLLAHDAGSCWAPGQSAPPSLFHKGCFQSILHPPCICAWDCPDPCAGPCTWLYWTSWGSHRPTLKACQDPSGWHPFPTLCQPHHTVWCHWQLAEGALNPTVHDAIKDGKWHQFQHWLLRNTTHHWSPLGYIAFDCKSLSAIIQPIFYPLNGPSIKLMSLQFRDKDVVNDSVKCFAPVQVDDISCSSLIHQHGNLIIEGYQICQVLFVLSEAMWVVTSQLLIFHAP